MNYDGIWENIKAVIKECTRGIWLSDRMNEWMNEWMDGLRDDDGDGEGDRLDGVSPK